jgi:hypothetical protein
LADIRGVTADDQGIESMDSNLEAVAPLKTLLAALETAAPSDALAWLRAGMATVASAEGRREALPTLFAGAMRRFGREALGRAGPLPTPCGPIVLDLWRRGDAARACLIVAATAGTAGWETLVTGLFRHGDEDERAAVIRSLCLLPEPCSALAIALEAGRTNSMVFYAALALDNPYPAACYDDHAYNHVVLKCLFNGLPVARIIGLRRRANAELTRMCEDYIGERRAAGRPVPADIWLPLEPYADAEGVALMLAHLGHPDPAHRLYAARALALRRAEPDVAAALGARVAVETHPAVRAALTTTEQ